VDEKKMKDYIEEKLASEHRTFTFDKEKKELRVTDNELNKGITLSIPKIVAKYKEKKETAVTNVVYTVEETFKAMKMSGDLQGKEKNIFPVIRSTSFPTESAEGKALVYDEHTAETRVYYALDLGKSYQLIDEEKMKEEKWNASDLKQVASFNVRSLQSPMTKDTVAGNDFYFINTKDGYDASRILNKSLLNDFHESAEGDMAVAVPHQDVLILADLKNEKGYDILGQMGMHFFTNGKIPITVMPFLYENGEFEPIFVFASKRSK
jgi:uncharacterized protein YtpQ (UPF0354 family)